MPICIKCKKEFEISKLELIDDSYICHSCLYLNYEPFKIYPIGFVENQLERGKGFGLKGKRAGHAEISELHANFIVNLGNAKSDDVIKLIELAKKEVRDKLGRQLEEEIQFLGL